VTSTDEDADQSDDQDDSEARTEPRDRRVAQLLAALSPGLGWMYVGKPWRGLAANLAYVAGLAALVGMFVVLEFFPLLPLFVLAVGWLVFTTLIVRDVGRTVDAQSEPYEPRAYNHWTIYSATVLLTYAVPLAAIIGVSTRSVWDLREVEDRAMYPTVQSGETILVDQSAYQSTSPERGELVALTVPGSDGNRSRILRVIAEDGDRIQLSADTIYVNGARLPRVPLDARLAPSASSDTRDRELWVEQNAQTTYVISVRPSSRGEPEFTSEELDDDSLYLLADNRSHSEGGDGDASAPRDSRDFGPVRRGAVAGKPLYVAWSTDPSTGAIRWDRIGTELQ
jgi:signal peptidase I